MVQQNRESPSEQDKRVEALVKMGSVAHLPTRHGKFQIVAFEGCLDKKEHVAIIRGDLLQADTIPVRIHSECLTGDVLGSLRCDCRDQLDAALFQIGKLEVGVIIYLRQEGRGIGLINKIRAYTLQDQGLDTFEANRALGYADDERDFRIAAEILKCIGVTSVKLMTNNPQKIEHLQRNGIQVVERIPNVISPNEHNRRYLETKQTKGGHLQLLDVD